MDEILRAVPLEDAALDVDALARACAVEPTWVVERVQAGLFHGQFDVQVTRWRFGSADLARARALRSIERDFEANAELAALVVDLSEEVRRLKSRLRLLGWD